VGDGTNRLENSNCQNLDYARLPEKPHGCFISNFSKKLGGPDRLQRRWGVAKIDEKGEPSA